MTSSGVAVYLVATASTCGKFRVDLGDLPTWVGAGAGTLALIAAGYAASAAWKVLALERARDDRQEEADQRKQAELVAAWYSAVKLDPTARNGSERKWGALVRNASLVPVHQAHVEYVTKPGQGALTVILELLPPGDWLVSGRTVYAKPEREQWSELPDRPFEGVALRFTDTSGTTWQRDRMGRLSRLSAGTPAPK